MFFSTAPLCKRLAIMHVATRCLCEQRHERDLIKPTGLGTIIDALTALLFEGIKPSWAIILNLYKSHEPA